MSTRKFFNLLTIGIVLILGLSLNVVWLVQAAKIPHPTDEFSWPPSAPPPKPLFIPALQSINPLSNSHTAPATTTVSITYNETINPAAVNTQTFAVYALQTGLLTQTYSVNSGQITLTPAQSFKPGELVQVSATTGTLNMSGEGPTSPTVWQFRVAVEGGSGVFTSNGQSLGGSISRGVDIGDLDGDGDLDAFVVNRYQGNRVWLNNGGLQGGTPGTFSDSGQSLGSANSVRVALGDVDGDGDLDAFVANRENQPDKVWLNNGGRQGGTPGVFSDSGQNLGSSYSSDVALGDVDGDGDLDAFVVNYSNQANKVWLNNGLGFFIDSGQSLGNSSSIELSLGDVDGDGDLDAVVMNDGDDKVWLNSGGAQGGTSGIFSDSGQSLESSRSDTIALGDVDGDGDLDAFISGEGLVTNKVWLNNGGVQGGTPGIFSDSGQSLGNTISIDVALGDVDGDGDLDAFTINPGQSQPNKVWLNNGGLQGGTPGVYSDSGQSLGSLESVGVALGDVDGDGDLDAFVANYGYPTGQPNEVWLNDQGATDFFLVNSVAPEADAHTAPVTTSVKITYNKAVSPTTVSTRTIAVHAMQTGLLTPTYDVLNNTVSLTPTYSFKPGELVQVSSTQGVSSTTGQETTLPWVWQFRTAVVNSTGIFTDSGQRLGNERSTLAALGDVDGDGDLDAFVANGGTEPNQVWLNDGGMQGGRPGYFTNSGQTLGDSASIGIALGDLDGDGDLDAAIGNDGTDSANQIWLNNGGKQGGTPGEFSNTQTLDVADSRRLALGDLDGDGDLDIFIPNNNPASPVWLNDGNGTFSASGQSFGDLHSQSVGLGDLDGDGDLDAFVTRFYGGPNQVWLNNGRGWFSDSGQSLGDSASYAVALGDLDGDGDLDAFVANWWLGQPNVVWLNNGGMQGGTPGTFTDSTQRLGNSYSKLVALGDLDGDGDLDAFVANENQPDKIWFNNGGRQGGTPGTFSESNQELDGSNGFGVALGDVDGDGDLDAFITNYDQPNTVWFNGLTAEPSNYTYLPIIFKPDLNADTTLYIESVNTGGATVRIYDLSDVQLLSCTAGDNTTQLCGTFASIGSYKIIVQTGRCGLLGPATFNDATGGSITRRVYCN